MNKLVEFVATTKDHLTKLSDDVHQAMVANGAAPAGANCRTVCSVSIGPDGRPVYTCSLVCDW
jgi:hypothetical protein